MAEFSGAGGRALYLVAKALGVRVTSYKRSAEVNASVGGAPGSAHLIGAAIDCGRETPDWKVALLKSLSVGPTDGWHEKGTAPHYHFTGGPDTLVRLGLVAGGLVLAWKAVTD